MHPETETNETSDTSAARRRTDRGDILLVDDPLFDQHRPMAYHPERPERLKAARAAIARSRHAFRRIAARAATDDELVRVHDASYVAALDDLRGEHGYVDPDTYYAARSVDAARTAAGGLVAMVDAMIDGTDRRGVALLRPPGHHARPAQAMGFCLLNSVAVAAAHARARGVSRVAVVDFDVHHGNGTQEIFWRDPSVLYVSTHQYPFYPGTGGREERGEGDGRGFTVNVPLGAGGGDAMYRGAFERVILPVLESYAPEMILVSAGFDAALHDPLAEMTVTEGAFGWMARALAAQAERSSDGRMALVLEGGYDLVSLESGLASAIDGMMGTEFTDVERDVDAADLDAAADAARATWAAVT